MPSDSCDSGYREVDHTADRRIEVWGPDLPSLLCSAAEGMYAVCGPEVDRSRPVTREFRLDVRDRASLLVGFLSELLYRLEAESEAFEAFEIDVDDETVACRAEGYAATGLDDEIKAVTWEDVWVEEESDSGSVRGAVTFDI